MWTIGREVSSGYEVVSGQLRLWQRCPAPHSSAQLAIVDRQPRQMASNQNSPISIWSGLNQMPGGELSLGMALEGTVGEVRLELVLGQKTRRGDGWHWFGAGSVI